jgi:Lrp/AsnC family transcriptional regulator for asnA, asnC and gidA
MLSDTRGGLPELPQLRSVVELSDLDSAIIRILQGDGRRSAAQIAREVGATERVVRRRLSELRDSGIIQITTVADPVVLGYRSLALLAIRTDRTRPATEVARELAELEACDYAVVITGRFDVLVEIVCRDPADLLRTTEGRVLRVPGVGTVETFPYLQLRYQEPMWERARSKTAAEGVAREVVALDEVDRALVRELSADGRAPFRDLSASLKISESQVRARVGRLTQSGAVRVMAITKPRSLGFETLAWLGVTVGPGASVADVADRLADVPSIAYLVVTAGSFDILAEAVCVDLADLARLLDAEVRGLPGVSRVEAMVCLDQHYERIRPVA